ncbi:MAG TPA: M48 family metallopeptidase [Gemmatimonadaceae bacterium]|nr:M48 family metallopeptidase [Gemmatimonadaceae bacterium]
MPRKPVVLLVSWLIFVAAAPPTFSQSSNSAAAPGAPSPPAAVSPAGADRARVRDSLDTERFDPEVATEAYMAKLSPEARARSDAYFEGGYWLLLAGFLYGLVVAWLLLATGLSARMRDLAGRVTGIRWLRTALYAVEYIVLTAVLTFPLTLYQGFFREHRYGLSNQSFLQWMRDEVVGLIVGIVFGVIALTIIYAVIRRAPRNWWIWGAGVAIILMVIGATIAPVYIAPLFNSYKPLPDSELRTQLLSMARANGIPADNVYVFDASKQSKRISANVSGMFGTVRISLNDNLMNRGTPEEIRAVLGHEMGHYVLNHVYKGVVYFGIIIVVGLAFVQWAFGNLSARWGERWGIRDAGDVAGLPLLVAIFSAYIFVLTPVVNTIVRSAEAEADMFGLNAAREPDGFAMAALDLSEYRKMHPGPVEEFIFFDHPSGWNRIHRSMVWKAEEGAR